MCTIYQLQHIYDFSVHFPFVNEDFNNCLLIAFIYCGRKKHHSEQNSFAQQAHNAIQHVCSTGNYAYWFSALYATLSLYCKTPVLPEAALHRLFASFLSILCIWIIKKKMFPFTKVVSRLIFFVQNQNWVHAVLHNFLNRPMVGGGLSLYLMKQRGLLRVCQFKLKNGWRSELETEKIIILSRI